MENDHKESEWQDEKSASGSLLHYLYGLLDKMTKPSKSLEEDLAFIRNKRKERLAKEAADNTSPPKTDEVDSGKTPSA